MAEATKSPDLVNSRLKPYYAFRGIDRSRPVIGMDDGKNQSLYILDNGYTDFRGTIRREPAAILRTQSQSEIRHMRFFNRDALVWAEQDGKAIHLAGERAGREENVFPLNSIVTSSLFRGKVSFMSGGFGIVRTDGYGWERSKASITPSFGVTIQGRMFCAGFSREPTLIEACRVNDDDVFTNEETGSSSNKASFIDIQNQIGTAEGITGLGRFEANRLAIFTEDQALVYLVDPDFNNWQIDNRANFQIGCISHNAITNVRGDIIFCSRDGVHALSRSDANGINVVEQTLSHEVEDLYKQLIRETEDPSQISAGYDQDLGLLHIYFPRPTGQHTRLSANMKQGVERMTWATGNTCGERCGTFLAGTMAFGTGDGVFTRLDPIVKLSPDASETDAIERGNLDICTPIHWHGAVDDYKESRALVLQANGSGTVLITAFDEEGQELLQEEIQVDGRDDTSGNFPNVPLEQQYRIPFELRYRGVQLQFRSVDQGDIRILGYAIELRQPSAKRGR